jgi:hypothetical protein
MEITSPDLAPDYYLRNFRFLLDWVNARYFDLLSEDERSFIAAFTQLEHGAQCLLVRLSSRKGPIFRRDKLSYSEITSIDIAAQQLINAALLQRDTQIDLITLAASLTKPELLMLFGEHLAGLKQARKEVLVETLATIFTSARSWQGWTHNHFGAAWHLDNQAVIRNLLLLFFGNSYQDLTEFVLQDLGLFRYENYTIDQQHRVFKTRAELEQYNHLVNLRDQLDASCTREMLLQLALQLPSQTASERLERRRAKLCNQLAYALERINEHSLALQLYEQSHLPPARERRIRLLEKQNLHTEAWALLNQLLEQPLDEQELQVAQRMAPRIAKKLGKTPNKRATIATITQQCEMIRLENEQGIPLRVEEVVRLSLDKIHSPCVYAENALLGALFGLWLWPEMFRSIEGAFANPFQAAPLDLYQENFVPNRPGINSLWQSLENGDYQQAIRQTWRDKHGVANHFVHWSFITSDLLDMALHCIPAHHLKLIFERLLFDIKNNRSGLPDLIQFFPEQKTYRMIEVKGPGDRIQDNQQRWLDYFAQHQIPAEVCYVRWQ